MWNWLRNFIQSGYEHFLEDMGVEPISLIKIIEDKSFIPGHLIKKKNIDINSGGFNLQTQHE
jgi:hypothetical protein